MNPPSPASPKLHIGIGSKRGGIPRGATNFSQLARTQSRPGASDAAARLSAQSSAAPHLTAAAAPQAGCFGRPGRARGSVCGWAGQTVGGPATRGAARPLRDLAFGSRRPPPPAAAPPTPLIHLATSRHRHWPGGPLGPSGPARVNGPGPSESRPASRAADFRRAPAPWESHQRPRKARAGRHNAWSPLVGPRTSLSTPGAV